MEFFAELKRRDVYRPAVIYAAVAWVLVQVVALVSPYFHIPEWVVRWVIVAAAIGLPFWLAFAWFFEFTPDGLKRESQIDQSEPLARRTGRKLDFAIIGVLAVAVVLLLTDRFVLRHGVNEQAAIAAPDRSIAVLPFVNLSSDKEQEFFSDGVSEDLLNLLTKIPQLQVTARTSSFSFKGKDVAIPDIARQLHVTHILSGSVRKSDDKVRITAQLIRAGDGTQLWSETYDRALDEVFKVQDEIAADVVKELQVKLLGGLPTSRPVDGKLYPLLLEAKALADRGKAPDRTGAVALYLQALAVSPHESKAWSGLARVYFVQALNGEIDRVDGVRKAREAANEALAVDPDNAAALALLGRIASDFEYDLPGAARDFQRALAADPRNLAAINNAANLLEIIGRLDQAVQMFEYRANRDPVNAAALSNLAVSLYQARRWEEALEAYSSLEQLSPGYTAAASTRGLVLMFGRNDATGALKACEADAQSPWGLQCMALALQRLNRKPEARVALNSLVEKHGELQPAVVAQTRAWLGEIDAAFAELDRAVANRDPTISLAAVDPLFDPMRGDPRWLPLLRKVGLEPEQLAKIEFKVTLPQ